MDGVTFHEEGKDAFGKPVERQVNKRIYSMAGNSNDYELAALRNGCLILEAWRLVSMPALAQTQEPAGATATASVISSVGNHAGSTARKLVSKAKGHLGCRAARMQNPDRLVWTFAGHGSPCKRRTIPGSRLLCAGVRLGQFRPDIVAW